MLKYLQGLLCHRVSKYNNNNNNINNNNSNNNNNINNNNNNSNNNKDYDIFEKRFDENSSGKWFGVFLEELSSLLSSYSPLTTTPFDQ